MNIKNKVILFSIFNGILVWIIDALLDAVIFPDQSFMDCLILHIPEHKIYIRLIIIITFFVFGMIISRILERLNQSEQTLKESEAFNFALFQYSPIETIVVDHDGRVLRSNIAKRTSGDKLPNIGDLMYVDYARNHTIDMRGQLMDCIQFGETKRFPELQYGNKFLSITIAAFHGGAIITSQNLTELKKADEKLKVSLREKEVLLMEIHHRVKNNLQVISSLLDMSSLRIKDQKAIDLFTDARAKIHTMALIHSQLYQSERFDQIEMGSHIRGLLAYLSEIYSKEKKINAFVKAEGIYLSITQAVPCALVLNELISNAYKHAFKENEKGTIVVSMEFVPKHSLFLSVKDDGRGMNAEEMDMHSKQSLGLKLVRNLVQKQLRGKLQVINQPGTDIQIEFALIED
jgi:two-component sensor histidine kinase